MSYTPKTNTDCIPKITFQMIRAGASILSDDGYAIISGDAAEEIALNVFLAIIAASISTVNHDVEKD